MLTRLCVCASASYAKGESWESYITNAFVRKFGASVFFVNFHNLPGLFMSRNKDSDFVCFFELSVPPSVVGIVSML